jgi:hypothetical protein
MYQNASFYLTDMSSQDLKWEELRLELGKMKAQCPAV